MNTNNKKKWFRRSTSLEWTLFGFVFPNSIKGLLWIITIFLLASFFSINSIGPITNNFGETFNIIAALVVVSIGLIVGVVKS